MTSRRSAGLFSVVLAAALAVGACSSDEPEQVCEGAGGARLCLTPKGDAYELSASGFQPGSQIFLAADGKGDRAIVVNAEGGIDPGGVVSVLGEDGPARPERVTVQGTAADGGPVTIEVVP